MSWHIILHHIISHYVTSHDMVDRSIISCYLLMCLMLYCSHDNHFYCATYYFVFLLFVWNMLKISNVFVYWFSCRIFGNFMLFSSLLVHFYYNFFTIFVKFFIFQANFLVKRTRAHLVIFTPSVQPSELRILKQQDI